jgi:DNA repair protein RecO (recombination protein O)
VSSTGPRAYRTSRAFLVRTADLGEADRRLSFFTESAGAVTLVAKSAHRSRKRFGGGLQRYFLLDIAWTEIPRRIPVLGDASVSESFWDILGCWERVRHADHLLELASGLFPQAGPKPRAFAHLLGGMRALCRGENPGSVARKAEAGFLALGGWGPDLSGCRRCGRVERPVFRFLPSEGGLYCGPCAGKGGASLSMGAVKSWRALQTASPLAPDRLRISEKILKELQVVIWQYLEWCLGAPLRSLRRESPEKKS